MRHVGQLLCAVMCAALAGGTAVAAETCAPGQISYMAIEPVKALLGARGETRAQYLDRVYTGWKEAEEETVRVAPPADGGDETIRLSVTPPSGQALERVDLIAEARIEYVDAGDRRGERFGHREIARYAIESDVTAEIAVPRGAFRESGALVVVLTLRRADPGVLVWGLPVDLGHCPRRIYTHDRFTAIRLNRKSGK